MRLLQAIKHRLEAFLEETADAVEDGNWGIVVRHILIAALAIICIGLVTGLVFLILWKSLNGFLGKVLFVLIGIPIIAYILYRSYLENHNAVSQKLQKREERSYMEVWAEEVYGYVRDAMFLVFRAVADYTFLVMPSAPSAIELPNGISIKDGYVVFRFFAKVRDESDLGQLERDLERALYQMLRAHELSGLPCELIQVNGAYYAPLQILDITDYGDSINVSVVFTDEKTVELTRARKLLHLELSQKRTINKRAPLYEDEL